MARAKLHLICGNCGCNDEWEYSIDDYRPEGECHPRDVFITCKNCSTLHTLSDNAIPKEGET